MLYTSRLTSRVMEAVLLARLCFHFGRIMKFLLGILGVVTLMAPVISGQEGRAVVTMASQMTPEELRTTGVASLSIVQRAALDAWIQRYTENVITASIKFAENSGHASSPTRASPIYAGTGSGHWIDEVSSDGGIVTLEDGSIWQISSLDQIDTALWLPVTDITVVRSASPVGGYDYTLVNTEDSEKASAKYIGEK